ncbi:MAG: hypothetical protein EZS28_000397, partial [Streblomastix strix]
MNTIQNIGINNNIDKYEGNIEIGFGAAENPMLITGHSDGKVKLWEVRRKQQKITFIPSQIANISRASIISIDNKEQFDKENENEDINIQSKKQQCADSGFSLVNTPTISGRYNQSNSLSKNPLMMLITSISDLTDFTPKQAWECAQTKQEFATIIVESIVSIAWESATAQFSFPTSSSRDYLKLITELNTSTSSSNPTSYISHIFTQQRLVDKATHINPISLQQQKQQDLQFSIQYNGTNEKQSQYPQRPLRDMSLDPQNIISCTAISGDAMVLAAGTCGGRLVLPRQFHFLNLDSRIEIKRMFVIIALTIFQILPYRMEMAARFTPVMVMQQHRELLKKEGIAREKFRGKSPEKDLRELTTESQQQLRYAPNFDPQPWLKKEGSEKPRLEDYNFNWSTRSGQTTKSANNQPQNWQSWQKKQETSQQPRPQIVSESSNAYHANISDSQNQVTTKREYYPNEQYIRSCMKNTLMTAKNPDTDAQNTQQRESGTTYWTQI